MFDLQSQKAHEIRAMMMPLVTDILEGSSRKRLSAFRQLQAVQKNLVLRRIFLSITADYARESRQTKPGTVIPLTSRPSSSAPPPICGAAAAVL